MLHKKSEYRLQYSKLSEDLRRQIWQDNVVLRKSRLLSNQATHYWEYQLRDNPCDCEDRLGNEEDSDDGPVPPHRKKHKELREQYQQHLSRTAGTSGTRDSREASVQTPEWSGGEPNGRLETSNEEELLKRMNRLALPEAKEVRCRPSTTSSRTRTARSLSRTTRKLATEPKITHFVPFGWNEKTENVGQKQTYNVCAPRKEVHDSALQASKRRRAKVDEFLVEETGSKQLVRTSRKRVCSNSSSIWMSEYQEKFSARSRPVSAPPAARPMAWRHS